MIQTPAAMAAQHSLLKALGDKLISSDMTLVIEGYENMRFLTSTFPVPQVGAGGEIEIPGPLGSVMLQPQQIKTHFQGQVTFQETRSGAVQEFNESVVTNNGAVFNAWIYVGTPEAYTRRLRLVDCFLVPDNMEASFENRAQVATVSGNINGHYFGEWEVGDLS